MKKQLLVLSAAAMVAAAAVPAMAETTLYGSARVSTFYNVNDNAATGYKLDGDFDEHLNATSRLGVNFSGGAVSGKVEIGLRGSSDGVSSNGLYTRLLYGKYNFGAGTLTVGQDYNNYYSISNQVAFSDNVNNGYGSLWDGRQPQLRVDMNSGLYFAAITPTHSAAAAYSVDTQTAGVENYIPKMNVGFKGKAGAFAFNAGAVGQSYKSEARDEQVNSLLGYFGGVLGMGPTTLKFNLGVGMNPREMNFASYAASTKDKDVTGYEGYVQASQKISDTLSANMGIGYLASKIKGGKTDDRMNIFVNAPITIAKGFTIVPEVDYLDELDNAAGKSQKTKQYVVGAKWQMDF